MHEHDHEHDHHEHEAPHAPPPDEGGCCEERLEAAVRALLVEKGVITADEARRALELMDSWTPSLGARVVARAWVDPEYRARLLADGTPAVEELGIPMQGVNLLVVENTPEVHNLVVCTLCSCYPRPLLGYPPAWYKSRAYRSRAVREPRAVLEEFGTPAPRSITVRVHDSTADLRYLVLPERPAGTEGWDEAALAELVTRDSMVGVARARMPGG